MGRPPLKRKDVTVKTTMRFPESLLSRIAAQVGDGKVAEFIRDAAEGELKRRERKAAAEKEGQHDD